MKCRIIFKGAERNIRVYILSPVHSKARTVLKDLLARHEWFTPAILATQEAGIRRIAVQSQPGKIVLKTLS
jgi:hypothetical protein